MSDRRRERGDETREKLLQGVFALVAEDGLPGLTAGKLSKAVGVSKSTIFHHFQSIDLLAVAAMRSWIDGILASLEGREYSDVDEYLETLGRAVLTPSEEGERYYRASMAFFHKSLCDPSFREAFAEFLEGYLEKESAILAGLLGLSPEHEWIRTAVSLLAGTLDGLAMHLAITKDQERCMASWQLFSRMLLRDISDVR